MPVTADAQQRFSAAWESFSRTTRRLRSRAGSLPGDAGLTLAQYHLLEPLREASALPVGTLAEGAGVAAPTATRMLDGLERGGWIERRHSARDRRCVMVSLTPAGERALATAHAAVEDWRRQVFARLEPDEREAAARLLERLTEALEEDL